MIFLYWDHNYLNNILSTNFALTIKSISTVSSMTCTDKATISVGTSSILIAGGRYTFINICKNIIKVRLKVFFILKTEPMFWFDV